jgi:bla regulator protein blaR1
MISTTFGPLADHLWQSTLVLVVVGVLAFVLRRNRAHVRYAMWLASSMKFLVPFAALIAIGHQVNWPQPSVAQPAVAQLIDAVGQPFSTGALSTPPVAVVAGAQPWRAFVAPGLIAIWALGSTVLIVGWIARWRRVTSIVRRAVPADDGRVVDALRRLAGADADTAPIALPIVISDAPMEPGIFGLRAPILVWPRGMEHRLTDAQVDAILLHELAHVRRRDNLTSVLHMIVQALFWFHPLTWWIGARLVDERERACDEDVVRAGSEPHVYAESILKTCQFSIESPLACVAGVTGSDLKRRIEHIMRDQAQVALNASKRVLLSAALVSAIAIPVAVGIVTSPRVAAQVVAPAPDAPTFEVASVKTNNTPGRIGGRGAPGRMDLTGMSLRRLIRQAYDIHESQIVGGPDWIDSQAFDVNATTGGPKPPDQTRLMMQTLLRDRFKLTFHTERRDLPVYALIAARSDGRLGDGLKKTPDGACLPPGAALATGGPSTPGPPPAPPSPFDPDAKAPCGAIIFGPGRLLAHGVPIDMLARSLGGLPAITTFNRIVENQTGLEGRYDFDFKFANEFAGRGGGFPPPGAAPPAAPGDEPALFTALQEQLGLKLDARRANVEVLVIDSVQKPEEN